jgi:patatin-like phospholipase/acyl hydrolase
MIMAKYRILSLDGGGIRGLITCIILQSLNDHQDLAGWLDSVDLIAGTSTGGLIALGLGHGLDLQEIRELYVEKGEKIFDDSWLDDLVDLGRIAGAEYDIRNLGRELRRILGRTTTLAQLQRRVLITTFDLDNESPDPMEHTWKPKLFHNLPGADSDGSQLAWKVGLYTSAAPTYFPSVDGFIDGGVYASNPSMCALAQSQDTRLPDSPPLSDVVLLSLGTGTSLVHIKGDKLDWGYAQWVKPLISIMLDGTAGIAHFQCKQILGDRYLRPPLVFPPEVSIPMDAVDRIDDMTKFAEGIDLADTVQWLKDHWL